MQLNCVRLELGFITMFPDNMFLGDLFVAQNNVEQSTVFRHETELSVLK